VTHDFETKYTLKNISESLSLLGMGYSLDHPQHHHLHWGGEGGGHEIQIHSHLQSLSAHHYGGTWKTCMEPLISHADIQGRGASSHQAE